MSKNTSVALGDYFEAFVRSSIESGRFKNASEVLRAGLRLLEKEEQKFYALRNAIDEGIESGIAEHFEPSSHLKQLKKTQAAGKR